MLPAQCTGCQLSQLSVHGLACIGGHLYVACTVHSLSVKSVKYSYSWFSLYWGDILMLPTKCTVCQSLKSAKYSWFCLYWGDIFMLPTQCTVCQSLKSVFIVLPVLGGHLYVAYKVHSMSVT